MRIWRQNGPNDPGRFETYEADGVPTDASFLEMLDILNDRLEREDRDPVAFDHDCREGICGSCGAVVNGVAHGPQSAVTLCQLHMRTFKDGDTLTIDAVGTNSTWALALAIDGIDYGVLVVE